MNFKKFGILFSLSTLLGINLTTTKALSQEYQAKAGFKWKEVPVTLAGNSI